MYILEVYSYKFTDLSETLQIYTSKSMPLKVLSKDEVYRVCGPLIRFKIMVIFPA